MTMVPVQKSCSRIADHARRRKKDSQKKEDPSGGRNKQRRADNRKGSYDVYRNSLKFLVGMTRFELATP